MIPYNHTREDSALTPCPICKAMQQAKHKRTEQALTALAKKHRTPIFRNGPGVGILAINVAGLHGKPQVLMVDYVRTMVLCEGGCGYGVIGGTKCLACEVADHWKKEGDCGGEHGIECFCVDCLG
jgi:hypothetical protein